MDSYLFDPVVKCYVFYSTVLLFKMLLMSALTSKNRFAKKVFANEEDIKTLPNSKISFLDPDVERVRRCHLNDMENVYLFILLSGLYCLTSPNYFLAVWHFRIFTLSRVCHTVIYLNKVDQPARVIAFSIGVLVCVSLICQILFSTL